MKKKTGKILFINLFWTNRNNQNSSDLVKATNTNIHTIKGHLFLHFFVFFFFNSLVLLIVHYHCYCAIRFLVSTKCLFWWSMLAVFGIIIEKFPTKTYDRHIFYNYYKKSNLFQKHLKILPMHLKCCRYLLCICPPIFVVSSKKKWNHRALKFK